MPAIPADATLSARADCEAEIKAEIKRRYPDWERWGLAPADMLMAAAGPAMEVVGRYSEVLDSRGLSDSHGQVVFSDEVQLAKDRPQTLACAFLLLERKFQLIGRDRTLTDETISYAFNFHRKGHLF